MKTLPPQALASRPIAQGMQSGGGVVKPVDPGSPFSPGQMLRALVVESTGNRSTLEIGGSRFEVQSKAPLSLGQSLELQVLSTTPKLELQITEDSLSRFFSRSLSSGTSNQDLSSFFTLLRQVAPALSSSISGSSLAALQHFAALQQGAAGQASGDFGPKIMQQLLSQLGGRLDNLFAEGRGHEALSSIKSAVEEIALLSQGKEQLSSAALSKLAQLSPADTNLFEILTTLRQQGNSGGAIKDATMTQLWQHLQLPADISLSGTKAADVLNTLKTGLAELIFLLKGPESLSQLFSITGLPSGLSTKAETEAILFGQGGGKEGERLQQLVNKLGLNLEGMLAAGKEQEAAKTLKFALMELVQNLAEHGKLAESGKQALNALEFFQLTQLQTLRQDALVVPLPLPFLEQGYLLVEEYQEQAGRDGEGRDMPEHFSLLLKLSPLGNLRIDFLAGGGGVYIRFNGQTKEAVDFLATFKDELTHALTSTTVHGVSFTAKGEDPLSALLKGSSAVKKSFVNTQA